MSRTYSYILAVAASGMVVFCALCLMSPERVVALSLSLIAAYALCCLKLLRKVILNSVAVLSKHPIRFLLLVLAFGVAARLCLPFVGLARCVRDESCMGADYVVLWQCVKDVASGSWPISKSWTTVVAYAGFCKVFGLTSWTAFCFSILLQGVTAILCYNLAALFFGRVAGVLAAAMLFLNPVFLCHCVNVATEHTFSLTIFLSMLLFIYALIGTRRACWMCSAGAGVSVWFCVWSRGEGILLWPVLLGTLALLCFVRRIPIRRGFAVLFISLSCIVCGSVLALAVNHHTSGARTVLCSDDNWWPRLFGANVVTDGMVNSEDMWMIFRRYEKDNGDPFGWGEVAAHNTPVGFLAKCPPQVIPYISDEIISRWSKMSFAEKIGFVLRKEIRDWAVDDTPLTMPRHKTLMFIQRVLVSIIPSVVVALASLWFIAIVLRRIELNEERVDMLILLVAGLVAGSLCTYAIAESAPRYGWLLHIMLPVFAAAVMAGQRKLRK